MTVNQLPQISCGYEVSNITLLFIALDHGLNCIRNICLDYTWGTRYRRPISIILLAVGITVASWGVDVFIGNPHLKPLSSETTVAPLI